MFGQWTKNAYFWIDNDDGVLGIECPKQKNFRQTAQSDTNQIVICKHYNLDFNKPTWNEFSFQFFTSAFWLKAPQNKDPGKRTSLNEDNINKTQ